MGGSGFRCHDLRRGMDVYDEDGVYLGSVTEVRLRGSVPRASTDQDEQVVSLTVGKPWRRWRRRRVDVRHVRNVALERVVLDRGA